MWSTQSPAGFSEVEIGLDASGHITAYQVHHYMPAMQDDRPIGALLAGLPTMPPPGLKSEPGTIGSICERQLRSLVYDRVQNLAEYGHGTYQFGQKASPIAVGLRDHTMRTPGQFQQNFPRELAISEAAALAKMNPLAFRLRHTKDERLIGALHAVRDASGWQSRPHRILKRGRQVPHR